MRSPARDAATNMALDEAMLRAAPALGATLVRLYTWDRRSVSFGRNQRCEGIYSAERCRALGVPVVRRLTGGRALLHARELTYAVAAPSSAAPSLRGGYDAINTVLLAALRSLGVDATVAAPLVRTAAPGLAPCFQSPSAGELVVEGAKLVGSAQHRDASAFLQHGSILLADDQELLRELAMVPLPPSPRPATLSEVLGDVAPSDVADALVTAVRNATTGDIVVTVDEALLSGHVEGALGRYRDDCWTWRR
jgi:lipoyl(octanoyl) transferase